MMGDTSEWGRLREVAGEIATAKALAAVFHYRGDKQESDAEADMQNSWREFDALVSKLRSAAGAEEMTPGHEARMALLDCPKSVRDYVSQLQSALSKGH